MKVAVRYMAQVKQAAGRAVDYVELSEPCTVDLLIARLAQERGGALQCALLTADGKLQPTLLLFVAGTQVKAGDSATLRDGDEVLILSPIAGG